MKVTVCQLSNDSKQFPEDWEGLVEHAQASSTELVLLPEMPFAPWLAREPTFNSQIWQETITAHDSWMHRLTELAPAQVLSSRPVVRNGIRLNEAFVWSQDSDYRPVHTKYYLPNETGFWEANWYSRGDFDFSVVNGGLAKLGFLICTEMWFTEHARAYGKSGAHLLACPRATLKATGEKWLAGGRVAAVMSGAFCLSSNRGGLDQSGMEWGGLGWIIEPEEGKILAVTSADEPFVTVDIDLGIAETAKTTYPRYVRE